MSPTVGTTLFSFTDEWRSGELSLTRLLERVNAFGLGPDVELVGYQSFRGLPTPSKAEVARFHRDVERLGLRPTVFGVYVDGARRAGRWLSVDESTAQLAEQLDVAAQLGFASTRAPLGMDTELLDRVVPVLEDAGLVLTFEVQGHHTPGGQDVGTLVSWLQANAGAPVGLTLDSSVAMPGLPTCYRQALGQLGMTASLQSQLEAAWRGDGPPFQRLAGFLGAIDRPELPEALRDLVVAAFIRFGHSRLDDWDHLLPWVRHAHAKLWDSDDEDTQVRAGQSTFVARLVRHAYSGSISSEFGGIAWLGRDEIDVFELTKRHVGFLRSAVVTAQTAQCVERAERLGLRPSAYLDLTGA